MNSAKFWLADPNLTYIVDVVIWNCCASLLVLSYNVDNVLQWLNMAKTQYGKI